MSTNVVVLTGARGEQLGATISGGQIVHDPDELRARVRGPRAIALVDVDMLEQVERLHLAVPVVALVHPPATATTIELLTKYPWLSNVASTALWGTRFSRDYLDGLLDPLPAACPPRIMGDQAVGRAARLAMASRRTERFERMDEFFLRNGISERTVGVLDDLAEELVLNALYDAPLEAKYFRQPVPRTTDVELPSNLACEISYGVGNGHAFLRVRDPFGALTRNRLLSVLARCATGNVSIDETRGGAGLGMWRVFSAATSMELVVVPGELTELTITLAAERRAARQLLWLTLRFDREQPAMPLDAFDNSITLANCAP